MVFADSAYAVPCGDSPGPAVFRQQPAGTAARLYTHRHTVRYRLERVKELIDEGAMHPSGLKAFEAHDERAARYSYEQIQNPVLDPAYERELKRNRKAWSFFESSPPSYRRAAVHWVMDAKRDETRRRRPINPTPIRKRKPGT